MAAGNGNGSNGSGRLSREDANLADAVWALVDGLKIETIKLDGLAQAITHQRVIPSANRPWKRQLAESIRQVAAHHMKAADRIWKAP